MLYKISLTAMLMIILAANSIYASSNESDHVGIISPDDLLARYSSFANSYGNFEPSAAELDLMSRLADKHLVVLFGTWCHDSVREVPRLLKLLDKSGGSLDALTLVAVNQNKTDPEGYSERFDLKFTPTFILLDGKNEIARVVERPKQGLAHDLVSQLESAE